MFASVRHLLGLLLLSVADIKSDFFNQLSVDPC